MDYRWYIGFLKWDLKKLNWGIDLFICRLMEICCWLLILNIG